jgi:hypothetical protein
MSLMNNYDFKQTAIFILFALIVALIAAIVIYCECSRRKILKPSQERIEDINPDDSELTRLLNALRELAQTDKKLAEVLRSFSLM